MGAADDPVRWKQPPDIPRSHQRSVPWRFSQLGIRPGDVPFEFHGGGDIALHDALQAADRGSFSDVDVINAQDCSEAKQEFRTVALYPRIREIPMSLGAGILPPSPAGSLAIDVSRSEREGDSYAASLIDLDSGDSRSRALWTYRDRASATWSSDGHWQAVTTRPLGAPSRCLLLDIERQANIDPLEKLAALPSNLRPRNDDGGIECEIFGWSRDEPMRVALTVLNLSASRGEPWRFGYFFDVATGRLIAAGSR